LSVLRQHWSLPETAQIIQRPPRRVIGWCDEGLVETKEFRGPRDHQGERYVDRAGLVKIALLAFLTEHLGERAALTRTIVRALPADVAHALDKADLEDGVVRDITFSVGDVGEVTLSPKFLRALVQRINEAGLTV
jgi:hypothetical protein